MPGQPEEFSLQLPASSHASQTAEVAPVQAGSATPQPQSHVASVYVNAGHVQPTGGQLGIPAQSESSQSTSPSKSLSTLSLQSAALVSGIIATHVVLSVGSIEPGQPLGLQLPMSPQ